MKVLFINPAWDAAGVSYKQAQAINKYTDWEARHFRCVNTFNYPHDITPENYNRDEFISIIKEASVLHFCSAIHSYPSIDWGFDWGGYLKNKICIFHDYCSFADHWLVRAEKKDLWNKCSEIGYDSIWSSVPQAVWIYKDCQYIPDIVDECSEEFSLGEKDYNVLCIGHFPTGASNNKNTNELLCAINNTKNKINLVMKRELSHEECIRLKKQTNLGFDALWRGFHGMTTVENLALGIPTMCNLNTEFNEVFSSFFQTSKFPFENTPDTTAVTRVITDYSNDLPRLRERSKEVRAFMENEWSAKNIANIMVNKYKELLEKKK